MAALTGNTAGSLKKMWPSVKKKALDEYPSFAGFLGTTGANITTKSPTKTALKAAGGRKRKVPTETEPEADGEADIEASSEEVKPKPAPKKGGRKKAAVAESEDEDAKFAPKKGGRKTKTATTSPNGDLDTEDKPKPTRSSSRKASEEPKSAPAAEVKKKGRPAKKVKKEEVKSEEDSADGGDGLGQYARRQKVEIWLSGTDDGLETIEEET